MKKNLKKPSNVSKNTLENDFFPRKCLTFHYVSRLIQVTFALKKINIFEIGKMTLDFSFSHIWQSIILLYFISSIANIYFFKIDIFLDFSSENVRSVRCIVTLYLTSALQLSCKQVNTLQVLTNYNLSLSNFPSPICFLRDYHHQRHKSKLENIVIFYF